MVTLHFTSSAAKASPRPRHPAFAHQYRPRTLRTLQYLAATVPILTHLYLQIRGQYEHLTLIDTLDPRYHDLPSIEPVDSWWYLPRTTNDPSPVRSPAGPSRATLTLFTVAFLYSGILSTLADLCAKQQWYKDRVAPKLGPMQMKLAGWATPVWLVTDLILSFVFLTPPLMWSRVAHNYACTGRRVLFGDDDSFVAGGAALESPLGGNGYAAPHWSEDVSTLRKLRCLEWKGELYFCVIISFLYAVSVNTTVWSLGKSERDAAKLTAMETDVESSLDSELGHDEKTTAQEVEEQEMMKAQEQEELIQI